MAVQSGEMLSEEQTDRLRELIRQGAFGVGVFETEPSVRHPTPSSPACGWSAQNGS